MARMLDLLPPSIADDEFTGRFLEIFERIGATVAERIDHAGDVDDAVQALIDEPGPALLDVAVAVDGDCLPMIPPGAAARDMIG